MVCTWENLDMEVILKQRPSKSTAIEIGRPPCGYISSRDWPVGVWWPWLRMANGGRRGRAGLLLWPPRIAWPHCMFTHGSRSIGDSEGMLKGPTQEGVDRSLLAMLSWSSARGLQLLRVLGMNLRTRKEPDWNSQDMEQQPEGVFSE